jgi:o-succinylbenzoate---CoA ligase
VSPPSLRAGDVAAARIAPGDPWLRLLSAAWDAGAAVFPVDRRLSSKAVASLVNAVRPTVLVDDDGAERARSGVAAEPGVAILVATSGTSAEPKVAEIGRDAVEAAVRASGRALGAGATDGWLSCLPLSHIGGLLVLLRAVVAGTAVVFAERFDPDLAPELPGRRFASVVPTQLARAVAAGSDLAAFDALLVGGAALPSELRARSIAAGAGVVETYGLTESCGGVVYDGVPLPGVDVRLGAGGSIELAGPTLMRGYRLDEKSSAAAFSPDGWLRTGDAGTFDPAGRLVVAGRIDEAIVSGGETIWPEAVEGALRTHPAIDDVAVAGRPDPEWGSRVVAFVVPAGLASGLPSLEEVLDLVAESLPRYAAPRELVRVERIPRTPGGKIRRSQLPG